MCGIVGYIGKKNTKEILLDGLKELEYRGYDSAGIAILEDGNFTSYKAVGKLVNLEEKTKEFETKGFAVGIGHTRWATHGKPTELNAHPHLGEFSYVVHNGIIENYVKLKKELMDNGVTFLSQTDTEVIVHQFERNFRALSNEFEAFKKTISELEGAFAILLVTKSSPDTIYFAKQGSPMMVGVSSEGEKYFASSDTPLIGHCSEAAYFDDGDFGFVSANEIALFNKHGNKKKPTFTKLSANRLSAQKNGYRFFMEKEIYEQSSVIADTLMGRLGENEVIFEEITPSLLDGINE
ncbi:MAG: glutamine--fructose-6-phosphate transaminase (isomerizing), partial [Epsilonproteobacteria bacterium]|nr:glutamine--fructose-6-phosphate transaminase (isomerizing) [Campylobacterota bacterium]